MKNNIRLIKAIYDNDYKYSDEINLEAFFHDEERHITLIGKEKRILINIEEAELIAISKDFYTKDPVKYMCSFVKENLVENIYFVDFPVVVNFRDLRTIHEYISKEIIYIGPSILNLTIQKLETPLTAKDLI